MISSKAVGAGAFVVIGLLLFAVALFLIGDRRMLFDRRFTVYTEFSRLGELEVGAPVSVAGAKGGEVVDIELPDSPSGKFRVKMAVREALHPIIRTDSIAVPQTEGLVGGVFVNIGTGTDQAPRVADGGTIPSRDPFQISDLLQQAGDTIMMIGDTVTAIRGDAETAVKEVAGTAEDARALLDTVRPDLEAIARNGGVIANDTRELVAKINDGQGTIGKLLNDDQLYQRFRDVADQTHDVMANLHQVSDEARKAIVDFRSKDSPAQGLLGGHADHPRPGARSHGGPRRQHGSDEAQLPAARLLQPAWVLRPRCHFTGPIPNRCARKWQAEGDADLAEIGNGVRGRT